MGAIPVVPSRRGAKEPQPCPDYIYKHRKLIGRFWARLKERRAVATRYDKTAISCAAGIAIAASLDWIKSCIRSVIKCERALARIMHERGALGGVSWVHSRYHALFSGRLVRLLWLLGVDGYWGVAAGARPHAQMVR